MNNKIKNFIKTFIPDVILRKKNAMHLDRQRAIFHKNGKELLELIDIVLTGDNISYWLNYGTLLGAIREKNFIAHDFDLDLALYWEDHDKIKDILVRAGLELVGEAYCGSHRYPENMELRFKYKGVFVDFDFFKIKDGKAYTFEPKEIPNRPPERGKMNEVITKELIINDFEGLKTIDFLGRKYNVPNKTEEYLIALYGENYMTPIKDFPGYMKNLKVYNLNEKKSYWYLY